MAMMEIIIMALEATMAVVMAVVVVAEIIFIMEIVEVVMEVIVTVAHQIVDAAAGWVVEWVAIVEVVADLVMGEEKNDQLMFFQNCLN